MVCAGTKGFVGCKSVQYRRSVQWSLFCCTSTYSTQPTPCLGPMKNDDRKSCDGDLIGSRTVGSLRQLWSLDGRDKGDFLIRPACSRSRDGLAACLSNTAPFSETTSKVWASPLRTHDQTQAEFELIGGAPAVITGCTESSAWPAGENHWQVDAGFSYLTRLLPSPSFCTLALRNQGRSTPCWSHWAPTGGWRSQGPMRR